MKKLLLPLLLLVIFSCSSDKEKAGVLIHYLPDDPSLVIRSNSFSTLSSDLKNNSFLSVFSKLPAYDLFESNLDFSSHLNPNSEVLISVSSPNDSTHFVTLVTRQHPELFQLDSLTDKSVETLSYDNISLQKVTLNNKVFYTSVIDSVFVAGNSQVSVESILKRHTSKQKHTLDSEFERAYNTLGTHDFSLLINGKLFNKTYKNLLPESQLLPAFTSWIAVNAEVQPGHFKVNGIALAQDTIPQLMNVFKGTYPQQNLLALVTPSSASGFVSYTFDDYDVIETNLRKFQTKNDTLTSYPGLFSSLNEIGVITKGNEKIVALHAISGSITEEFLAPLLENVSEFRGVAIQKLQDSAVFKNAFYPLINTTPKFGVMLEDFFVFGESQSSLQEIITEYLNETTVGHLPYYEEHMEHMSSESSLLMVALLPEFRKNVAEKATGRNKQRITDLQFGSHRMAALQFVYDNNFAHVNGIARETRGQSRGTGVSQLFAITLENELLSRPQFFTNHITKGKDIVVQDVANKLYLIASNGRVQWTKQLDGAILGDIQEVDLLRNGRIQLAFTTKNTFYVLDRNGNEVKPFPLKFRDEITQPLAIFDYDNNRNYRFVVTQGAEVLMYDNSGRRVTGFTFNKAGSRIVLPAKHLRISNRDYLLFAEQSGKLNILHRTGQSRITVNEKFKFGESAIYVEDNQFVFITSEDEKVSIDQNGKVTKQKLNSSSENVVWEISGNTKVTLDDNILRINNQKVELPFGIYTTPKISVSNRRILISVTDLQQQRTYVYNSLGELLSNFPVYGTSIMQFGDANNNGRPNGVVKGGAKEVVLYEVN
jgi:hypothetical protein